MTEAYEWKGRTMIGSDDEKIGKISEIYEDPQTGKPEWATVSSGLFGGKSNFVPLAGASPAGEDIRAQVTKEQVKSAPGVEDDDGDLSQQQEQRLFEHYGVPYTTDGSTTATGRPEEPSHQVQRGVVPDAEEPVIERNVVAEERTLIGEETITEERRVSERIRKVHVDSDAAQRSGHEGEQA